MAKKTFKIEITDKERKNILNALRGWSSRLYEVYKLDKKKASNKYVMAYGELKELEKFFMSLK